MIGSKVKAKSPKGATQKTVNARKPTPKEADDISASVESGKKRGRPKGSTSGSKGPLGAAGVRVKRKSPDDIKDTRAAIARYREDINKLVEREKNEHPGAIVRECPDLFSGTKSEGIPAAFFATSLMGPMMAIYGALDVMSVFPSPQHFENLGLMWAECSKHFEFGKWAVLSGCLLATGGMVGGAVLQRMKNGTDTENGKIGQGEGIGA